MYEYEMLMNFIKPELIILIPVLYLVGMAIKKSHIKDKYIPRVLGITAIVLSLLFVIATTPIGSVQEAIMSIFLGITQGILCAGASVYFDQLVKQKKKDE